MDFQAVQKRTGRVTLSDTPPKGKSRRKRAYVPRRTRRFQLRNGHPEDMHVAEILDYARTKRQEVTMIRQGVALEYSLQRGDPSILFERFPWIIDTVKKMVGSGGGDLDEIKGLLEVIAANQKANGGYTMASEPAAAQPAARQLGGFVPLAMPVDDDEDELPAIVTRAGKQDSAANFLRGLQGIQH